jgi:hypothetical protein
MSVHNKEKTMRAKTTLRRMVGSRTRRIAIGFVVVMLTSISVMNFASRSQAANPGYVSIAYFNATSLGGDEWFLDGVIQASDMSAVTITMGGAATSVGTITPDEFGFFSFELEAISYDNVTADATDGIADSQADLTLYGS